MAVDYRHMFARLTLAATLLFTQPSPARILFIGISLTYSNDLPAMMPALSGPASAQHAADMLRKVAHEVVAAIQSNIR